MEYAKDEFYSISYKNETKELTEKTSSIFTYFKENRILKIITILTGVLSLANLICIYNFFSILSKL